MSKAKCYHHHSALLDIELAICLATPKVFKTFNCQGYRVILVPISFDTEMLLFSISSLNGYYDRDSNSEVICVLFMLITTVSQVDDLMRDPIVISIYSSLLLTTSSCHIAFSLYSSSSYKRLCSVYSEQSWSDVGVW